MFSFGMFLPVPKCKHSESYEGDLKNMLNFYAAKQHSEITSKQMFSPWINTVLRFMMTGLSVNLTQWGTPTLPPYRNPTTVPSNLLLLLAPDKTTCCCSIFTTRLISIIFDNLGNFVAMFMCPESARQCDSWPNNLGILLKIKRYRWPSVQ